MPPQIERALLVPVGGGDPIPLVRARMTLGRRESCDVCLRFPNISGEHCEVSCQDGMWYIRDLASTNGTKVNGERVQQKLLRPGDEIGIAKRRFTIQYVVPVGRNFIAEDEDLKTSLLEKSGLQRQTRPQRDEDDD